VIWSPPENLIVSTGFSVITPAAAPTSFLYYATTTDAFVGYLENHAKGAAYPAVVAGDFERASVVVPTKRLLTRACPRSGVAAPGLAMVRTSVRHETIDWGWFRKIEAL
jgi:hypothetical protein